MRSKLEQITCAYGESQAVDTLSNGRQTYMANARGLAMLSSLVPYCILFSRLLSIVYATLLRVRTSIILNSFIFQTTSQVRLDTNWKDHSAFLVTFHNRMEPHTRCAAIGTLMTFTSVDDNVSVGCIHYMVHLFSSPLNVTFWSVRAVPDLVTVVVSAVRFSCVPFDPLYRRCDTRPEMCIARTLFCDGHDNCGLAADEQGCGPDAEDTYTHLAITILDDRSGMVEAIACAVTSVVVIGLLGVVYIWRHRTVQKRKRQSRCLRRMLGMGESDIHEEHDETVALLAWTLSTQWLPYMSRKS